MLTHKELEEYILGLDGAWLDYPFGEDVAVYKIGGETSEGGKREGGKMFALIQQGSEPVRLSLKCDPQLALILREKYETVLPGYHLNKKHWNTIICSGQLGFDEIKDFINLSYQLVE